MLPKKPSKEENYQYLAGILKTANVDSREKAQNHIKGLRDKALKFSLIPIAILVLGKLILPKLMPIWFMLGLFGLTWIWLSTFSTIQMIKRFIEKEFQHN